MFIPNGGARIQPVGFDIGGCTVPVPPPTTALVFVPISGRALRVSERALWTMRWPYNAKSRLFIVFYMYRISF